MESLNLSTIKQDTHLLVINQLQFNQLMGNHKLMANNQFMASHLHNTVRQLHLHSTHNLYSTKQDIHKAKLHHNNNR